MRRLVVLMLMLFTITLLCGQAEEPTVYIEGIEVEGNRKTQVDIILRELLIEHGDTIILAELSDLLKRSEELIMNTGLFNRAQISFKKWEGTTNRVSLLVMVEEGWYLYPVPVFELADRNFNVWWVEQGRSLKRTIIGIDFSHINISGRKDKLRLSAKYGYTQKYQASYDIPFINKAQTLGLSMDVAWFRNREINYSTDENKQLFYNEDRFIWQRFRANLGATLRPKIKSNHKWTIGYRQNKIDEIVAHELNPAYFLDGRSHQQYFRLTYSFLYENRDARDYPWRGYMFFIHLAKDGLGFYSDVNALELTAEYRKYIPIGNRWSFGLETKNRIALIRSRQPYNINRAMGYGNDYLRGFEYYVIDGLDMSFLKTSMRLKIWEYDFDFSRMVPIDAFKCMPLRINMSFNNDIGYVNSPYYYYENPLNNMLLWGGGLGLDFVFFYNKIVRIEYSLNDLLENGLFLHFNMNI
ncbi:MAG: BamA/TamA family outer membrane protein [Chitinophagales bacterium]|nr:BamA/TamA family outer membrane protein [Chitinophagales bacterium]